MGDFRWRHRWRHRASKRVSNAEVSEFSPAVSNYWRESQICTLTPNFNFGFKNVGLQPRKFAEIANFWYKFAPKGYIPLEIFTTFGTGKIPQSASSWQISPLLLYKCGPTALRIAKIANFQYNCVPKEYIPLSVAMSNFKNFWSRDRNRVQYLM